MEYNRSEVTTWNKVIIIIEGSTIITQHGELKLWIRKIYWWALSNRFLPPVVQLDLGSEWSTTLCLWYWIK